MGKHIPTGQQSRRTIADTLLESEYEHYLDCPNADFIIRISALFLDFILCSVSWSATNHLSSTLAAAADALRGHLGMYADWTMHAIQYSVWLLRITMLYLYFIWATALFGGTPAKILLGLRVLDARTGQRLSLPRTFVRELVMKAASIISIFGVLMMIFRSDKRALHDVIMGTVVKRIRGEP